jgi:hypothetical protein
LLALTHPIVSRSLYVAISLACMRTTSGPDAPHTFQFAPVMLLTRAARLSQSTLVSTHVAHSSSCTTSLPAFVVRAASRSVVCRAAGAGGAAGHDSPAWTTVVSLLAAPAAILAAHLVNQTTVSCSAEDVRTCHTCCATGPPLELPRGVVATHGVELSWRTHVRMWRTPPGTPVSSRTWTS